MRAAVAGAGIAGLTSAIALAQRGISVDIFERAPDLQEIGAGIQLSPNATALLERLGLMADLADHLVEPEAIEIHDGSSGRKLAAIPLGAAARRRYRASYCLIRRADLQAGLLAAVRQHPNILLHVSAELGDVEAERNGIAFSAGGRKHSADLLVAADGLHSHLRTDYFGHPGPRPLGHIAWRATLPADSVPAAIDMRVTGLWLGPGTHLVHYPVAGGKHLNVIVIAAGNAADAAPPKACFRHQARHLLDAIDAWTRWPLYEVDAALPWVRGQAVLIGDAAHAMAPSAAQGGAQAIEDAFALAATIAAHSDIASGLKDYERVRRSRVEKIARMARTNLAIYEMRGFSAAARNGVLGVLPASFLHSRFDWIFAEGFR